ncbi:hypothetical protein ACFL2H_11165 [Planctomycetota bacterium]
MSGAEKKVPNAPAKTQRRRARGSTHGLSILATGEPFVWLTGGALILCLVMIAMLLFNVVQLGGSTFIPLPLVEVRLNDGRVLLGEVVTDESVPLTADDLLGDNPENANPFIAQMVEEVGSLEGLSSSILARTEPLETERGATELRLESVRKKLEQTTVSLVGRLDSVTARRKYAAGGSAARVLLETKTLAAKKSVR